MFKISLCTQSDAETVLYGESRSEGRLKGHEEALPEVLAAQARANALSEETLRIRTEETAKFSNSETNYAADNLSEVLSQTDNDEFSLICTFFSSLERPLSPKIIPLDECILSIVWEITHCAALQQILGDRTIRDVVVLLHSAAVYQADLETVSSLHTFCPIGRCLYIDQYRRINSSPSPSFVCVALLRPCA